MKIAVFGAGGFIGSHLIEHFLASSDHELFGFDLEDEKLRTIEHERFVFVKGDIRSDLDTIQDLVIKSDVVIDLIAHANPSLYIEVPLEVVDLNLWENLKITDMCVEHGKRLIQYSSCEVYGKPFPGEEVWSEDSESVYGPVDKQRWVYACAKQLLERILFAHGQAGNLEYSIIRPFNFVGPRMDYLVSPETMGGPRVFAHFMSSLLWGGPIHLVDGGEVHRTFLSIFDANTALEAILNDREGARNQIFNVGNPANHIKIKDLASLMIELYEELTGRDALVEIKEVSSAEFYGPTYEDTDRLPPDITRLTKLGWEPARDLRTTFRDAMVYYLEREKPELVGGRSASSRDIANGL